MAHLDRQRLEKRLLGRSGRREGAEIRFLCPAHDDRNPSARYHPEKATWYCDVCHQGGGWRDLAHRLGEAVAAPARHTAAIYPYRDAQGTLLYEVLRFQPKAFACRRPDPTDPSGWRWNLQRVERVLYRLPETLAARDAGAVLFLTEGEKDADALAALGLPATTHPGGAGKWRPSYTTALAGTTLVLLPDQDEPGRRHMDDVEEALRPVARVAQLRLPGLPEKGDVSDWLAARRAEDLDDATLAATLRDLAHQALQLPPAPLRPATVALAPTVEPPPAAAATTAALTLPPPAPTANLAALDLAPDSADPSSSPSPSPAQLYTPPPPRPVPPRIRRLSEITARPVHFLWHPYLPLGKLTLLDGDPGQGKSWLTAALATAGSHGAGLPGTPPFDPFTTLFLTEDPAEDVLRPRLDMLGADCSRILTYDTLDAPLDLSLPTDVAKLDQLIPAYRARLVVIDPIQAFLGAKTDIYRPNEVRAVLAPLLSIAHRHACALLILRHITKARASRSIYAGQGSVDFIAAARSVLLAGSGPEDPSTHALVHIKSNLAPTGPALAYRFDGRAFLWQGTSPLSANDILAAETHPDEAGCEEEARRFLRDLLGAETLPARTVLAAAREAGIAERTLKRAKRRAGILTLRQGFGAGSTWLWSLPTPEAGHPQTWPPSSDPGPLSPAAEHPGGPPPADDKVTL